MRYFPLFIDTQNLPCLIVGAGEVAARKLELLLKIETDELLEDKVNKEGELSESLARLELEEKKLEKKFDQNPNHLCN